MTSTESNSSFDENSFSSVEFIDDSKIEFDCGSSSEPSPEYSPIKTRDVNLNQFEVNEPSCSNVPKHKLNRDNWEREKRRKASVGGKQYSLKDRELIREKPFNPGCLSNCRLKCQDRVSQEERVTFREQFRSLPDHHHQRQFLLGHMLRTTQKTRVLNSKLMRKPNWNYFLSIRDNKIRVCKKMLVDTLGISNQWIQTISKKIDQGDLTDGRGKHQRRRTDIETESDKLATEHINSFPRMESHYVRKGTNKEYLSSELSKREMYRLYKVWLSVNHPHMSSISQRRYIDIISNDFNLSFYVPKKDRCSTCESFKNQNADRDSGEWCDHLEEKDLAQKNKNEDKTQSIDLNSEIITAIYDFQKILVCPYSNVGTFYYKRNFHTFNFSIYSLGTKEGYNYVWNETEGKRGCVEVTSCLKQFIETQKEKNPSLREIRFWSDNCAGQNKNRTVLAFLLWAAKKYEIKISQKYFTSGHSHNECDSMHARIENRRKNRELFVPDEYVSLIKFAKVEMPYYNVIEMKHFDFLNFKHLLTFGKFNSNDFLISKVKEYVCDGTTTIKYKSNWNEECRSYTFIDTPKAKGRRPKCSPEAFFGYTPVQEYHVSMPITKAKYDDLISLCDSNLIPPKYHTFYRNLNFTGSDLAPIFNEFD